MIVTAAIRGSNRLWLLCQHAKMPMNNSTHCVWEMTCNRGEQKLDPSCAALPAENISVNAFVDLPKPSHIRSAIHLWFRKFNHSVSMEGQSSG
jgi:hypothetical protein